MPAKNISDAFARNVKLPRKSDKPNQIAYIDTLERGLALVLVVSYGGSKTFRVLTYDASGRPKTHKLGRYPAMKVKEARAKARDYYENPEKVEAEATAGTFKDVGEAWFEDHVVGGKRRSAPEIRRHLNKYVYPSWKDLPFVKIRREAVSTLLDGIAKNSGRPQADAVLATIRSIMVWYQPKTDHYVSPIVKAMKKDKRAPEEKQRDRTLDDSEIKAVWRACDELGGSFAGIIKLALLTGQRREKIAAMKWSDIDFETGVWTIATEEREKGNVGKVKLPPLALAVIEAQPNLAENPHLFPAHTRKSRDGYFNSWGQRKGELDEKLSADMPPWVIHDLRRTTRTIMADLGIPDHIAERTLGHKLQGVLRTYNRHPYHEEKAEALAKVAARVETIINPPEGNVIRMEKKK